MQPNHDQAPGLPFARIPARTRRQAMDWALVLVSQGIEPVIEQTEAGGWALVVAPEEHEKSVAVIRLYRLENLRWPWRKPIFKTHAIFDWGVAAWLVLTVVFYWLSDRNAALSDFGIMNGKAVAAGEWWRL